jgi:hypothetical protein
MAQRFASLSEQIDGYRQHNARAFEANQPVSLLLPFAMGQQTSEARVDYAAEFAERDGRRGPASYNIVLSLDLTHTGPLQFRLHLRRPRVSLEIASPEPALLDIAESMRESLRANLERHGFVLDQFTTSQKIIDPDALSANRGLRALSVNA